MSGLSVPVGEVKDEGNPEIVLDEGEMPGIEVSHHVAVVGKHQCTEKGSRFSNPQGSGKAVHEKDTDCPMQYHRVAIGQTRRQEVEEKAQGVEDGCLDICEKGRSRKDMGVPKWDLPLGANLVVEVLFPGMKLKGEISAGQRLSREDDLAEKQDHRGYEKHGRETVFYSFLSLVHIVSSKPGPRWAFLRTINKETPKGKRKKGRHFTSAFSNPASSLFRTAGSGM